MMRIYADFNSQNEQGRVVLDTVGSRQDIGWYTCAVTLTPAPLAVHHWLPPHYWLPHTSKKN